MIQSRYNQTNRDTILNTTFSNSRRNSTMSSTTQNSFHLEIDNNFDIDENIRSEINSRFNRSIVNATYKFPRITYHPFPSISLQQKCTQKDYTTVKRIFRKKINKGQTKIFSHTPKPSLIQNVNLSKKGKIARASPSPEFDLRMQSITPTPININGKRRKKLDFPQLRNSINKTPVPIITKQYKIL